MTVDELIDQLGEMPADANVCLQLKSGEVQALAMDFAVKMDDDGWVVLGE